MTTATWAPPPFTGTPRPVRLTVMQAAVLESLCEGKDTDGICTDHGIAINTVKTHVRGLLEATGTRDRVEVVALARSGALDIEVAPPAGHWTAWTP